jgi:hypothetical protein
LLKKKETERDPMKLKVIDQELESKREHIMKDTPRLLELAKGRLFTSLPKNFEEEIRDYPNFIKPRKSIEAIIDEVLKGEEWGYFRKLLRRILDHEAWDD